MLKALRPCKYPGCNQLTKESYCDIHKVSPLNNSKETNKAYDKHKRDKKSKAYYSSHEWEKVRALAMTKYNHLDVYEYYINKRVVQANTIHHIIPIKEDWEKRNNLNNLIALSETSHNLIHRLYKSNQNKATELLKELVGRWDKDMA